MSTTTTESTVAPNMLAVSTTLTLASANPFEQMVKDFLDERKAFEEVEKETQLAVDGHKREIKSYRDGSRFRLYQLIGSAYGIISKGLYGTEEEREQFTAVLHAHGLNHGTGEDNPWYAGVKLLWWKKTTTVSKKTGAEIPTMKGNHGDNKYAKVMRWLWDNDVRPQDAARKIDGFTGGDYLNGVKVPAKMFGIMKMDTERYRQDPPVLDRKALLDDLFAKIRSEGKAFEDYRDTNGDLPTTQYVMCACVVIAGELRPVTPLPNSHTQAEQIVVRRWLDGRKAQDAAAEQQKERNEREAQLRAALEGAKK